MTPQEQREAEAKVAAYKSLPTLITAPGEYLTRDGRKVSIHTLSTASATGAIWREFRGRLRPRGIYAWDFNGRVNVLAELPRDIVQAVGAAGPDHA